MKISREQVLHVATLARVGLTEEEVESYSEHLSAILEYMDVLNEIDTTNVAPSFQVMGLDNIMRADEPRPALPADAVLANAPQQQDGLFRIPPVMEEDEAARVDRAPGA